MIDIDVYNLLQRRAIPQYLQGIPSGLSFSFSQLLQSFENAFPRTTNISRRSEIEILASKLPLKNKNVILGRHGSDSLCRDERENKMAATYNVLVFKR